MAGEIAPEHPEVQAAASAILDKFTELEDRVELLTIGGAVIAIVVATIAVVALIVAIT
jgi:hypothetical protein